MLAVCVALPAIQAGSSGAAGHQRAVAHTRIIFKEGGPLGGGDVLSLTPTGESFHRIARVPSSTRDLAADAGGRRIAAITSRQVAGVHVEQIYILTPGKGVRKVLDSPIRGAASDFVALSPNGGRIAFGQGGQIWVVDADGKGRRQVTDGPARVNDVGFTPDGRSIVYILNHHLIIREGLSGGARTDLLSTLGFLDAVSVASTGSISYGFTHEGGDYQEIHVMRADGSGDHSVYRPRDPYFVFEPDFSPSGRSVAFVSGRGPDSAHRHFRLMTVRASGRNPRIAKSGFRARPIGLQWTKVP